ncbi:MAG: hypothetical protein HC820_07370 [Hydrococcus sp. RM1_1_31]|nr:hypothetical protein [Hydrococcus sp. RM1_1_31]
MNKTWKTLFAIALLFMFVLAPFAGLAPLMLFLLGAGVLWALGAIAQVLFFGDDIVEKRE